MFITCQECTTTYRLDEQQLKPDGSKVRCSQCRHVFVAKPPVAPSAGGAAPWTTAAATAAVVAMGDNDLATAEQELEGIDLAELDALLAKEVAEEGPSAAGATEAGPTDPLDPDLDFEAAFEPATLAQADDADATPEAVPELDLDMDFEIHDTLAMDLDSATVDAEAQDAAPSADDRATDEALAESETFAADDLDLEGLDLMLAEEAVADSAASAEGVNGAAAVEDDLDLNLEGDLDFDLETESEASAVDEDQELELFMEDAPAASEGAKEAALAADDLDLSLEGDLDFDLEPESEAPAADEDQELDLFMEDEPAPSEGAKEATPTADDLDLSLADDLDFDLELESEAPAVDEDQELELFMEDEPGPSEGAKEAAPTADDLDLSLADDLDFDLEPESEAPAVDEDQELELFMEDEPATSKEKRAAAPPADDLDLSLADDLELSLDDDLDAVEDEDDAAVSDAPTGATAPVAGEGPSAGGMDDLDLDFDLDLDLDDDPPEAAADDAAQDRAATAQGSPAVEDEELDLSDLDALMATTGLDDSAAAQAARTEEDDALDFDLRLDEETEVPSATAPTAARAGDTLAEDEIDLSDIEQMLEDGGASAPKAKPTPPPAEEDLGFGATDDELDLSEIESAIDEADLMPERKVGGADADDQELELAFDLDAEDTAKDLQIDSLDNLTMEKGGAADSLDLDLDLDLDFELDDKGERGAAAGVSGDEEELGLADLMDGEDDKGADIVHSGDIELEFQVEEDEPEEAQTPLSASRTAGAVAAASKTAPMTHDEKKPTARPRPKPYRTKKKTSKSLVLLLVLALLGGGAYGLYYAVEEKGVEIPYVSDYVRQAVDYFQPAPVDPQGILNLSTTDIASRFIENADAGRLFVITGQVRNGYNTPRSLIRVQGRLFTQGKVLAKTEFSYAGLVLDNQDLAGQSIVELHQLLKTAPGDPDAATTVRAGQSVPFMLVFADLPPADQLDEFAVELISSQPAS